MPTKKLLLIYGTISVFLILGGYLYYRSVFNPPAQLTNVQYVQQENSSFRNGRDSLLTGDPEAAEGYFISALDSAQNPNQEAYIKYYLASAKALRKDYPGAVSTLKEIAENQNYGDSYRAYAIEAMGELFYRNNKDPQITELVFSSKPYQGFLDDDIEASYGRLFKYALTIYPTGKASYRAAIAAFYENSSTTDQQFRDAIMRLGDDITLFQDLGIRKGDIAELYMERGNLLGSLVVRGNKTEATDAPAAEADFKKALDLSGSGTGLYMKSSYYYALFLARKYGQSRAEDVAALLEPFGDPVYEKAKFYEFLKDKNQQNNERIAENLRSVGDVDIRFKRLMESLGWKL